MKFIKNGELQDEKILTALHKAADWYADGAIIETRDMLTDIVNAINEFDRIQDGGNGK